MILKMSDARPLLGPLKDAVREYDAASDVVRELSTACVEDAQLILLALDRMSVAGEKLKDIMRKLEG